MAELPSPGISIIKPPVTALRTYSGLPNFQIGQGNAFPGLTQRLGIGYWVPTHRTAGDGHRRRLWGPLLGRPPLPRPLLLLLLSLLLRLPPLLLLLLLLLPMLSTHRLLLKPLLLLLWARLLGSGLPRPCSTLRLRGNIGPLPLSPQAPLLAGQGRLPFAQLLLLLLPLLLLMPLPLLLSLLLLLELLPLLL